MNFMIQLDNLGNRLRFRNGTNKIHFNVSVDIKPKCYNFEIEIEHNLRKLSEPMIMELHHKTPGKFDTVEEFCKDCVLLNPRNPTMTTGTITVDNECIEKTCIVDLELQGRILDI